MTLASIMETLTEPAVTTTGEIRTVRVKIDSPNPELEELLSQHRNEMGTYHEIPAPFAVRLGGILAESETDSMRSLAARLLENSATLQEKLTTILEESLRRDGIIPRQHNMEARMELWNKKTGCKVRKQQEAPRESLEIFLEGLWVEVPLPIIEKMLTLGMP